MKKTFTKSILLIGVFAMLLSQQLFSQSLFKDLITGMTGSYAAGSSPEYFTNVAGTLYFSGKDKADGSTNKGYLLYKSDGTAAGTYSLANLGATTGLGALVFGFFDFNGITTFVNRSNGGNHSELWRTDGTIAGTYMIKSFFNSSYGNDYPQAFSVAGSKLFFSSNDGNGVELWVTDGTTAGTYEVKDLWTGTNALGLANGGVQQTSTQSKITAYNGKAYFWGFNGSTQGLFSSDGTAAGTTLVKALNGPGKAFFKTFNNELYFSADDGNLWKTDGTTVGTTTVTGISGVNTALILNNNFYVSGTTLYKTDGTAAGTTALQNNAGMIKGAVGNTLYTQYTLTSPYTYYKSDGTVAGTQQVPWRVGVNASFDVIGNKMYLTRADSAVTPTYANQKIWETDGTFEGTRRSCNTAYGAFYIYNNEFFYANSDATHGLEPWVCDPASVTSVIENKKSDMTVKVFPNPSNGIFNFHSSLLISEIKIYNTIGELVFDKKINSQTTDVDLTEMTSGVYFYQIIDEKSTVKSGKLILE